MASYVVMEPPAGEVGTGMAVLVRDGFHFLAFILPLPVAVLPPPVARRPGGCCWSEILIGVGLLDAAEASNAGAFLSILVSIYVGLEGERHAAGGDGSAGLARMGSGRGRRLGRRGDALHGSRGR